MTTNEILFLVFKIIHILAVIVAVGFNLSYGFWVARARREPEHLDFVLRGVSHMDLWRANPAYGVAVAAGVGMVAVSGYSFRWFWLWASLALLGLVGLVWAALYRPIEKRQQAARAAEGEQSAAFQRATQQLTWCGYALLAMVLAIVVLMVVKPINPQL